MTVNFVNFLFVFNHPRCHGNNLILTFNVIKVMSCMYFVHAKFELYTYNES